MALASAILTFLSTARTRFLRPRSYHKIVVYTTLLWFMRYNKTNCWKKDLQLCEISYVLFIAQK